MDDNIRSTCPSPAAVYTLSYPLWWLQWLTGYNVSPSPFLLFSSSNTCETKYPLFKILHIACFLIKPR